MWEMNVSFKKHSFGTLHHFETNSCLCEIRAMDVCEDEAPCHGFPSCKKNFLCTSMWIMIHHCISEPRKGKEWRWMGGRGKLCWDGKALGCVLWSLPASIQWCRLQCLLQWRFFWNCSAINTPSVFLPNYSWGFSFWHVLAKPRAYWKSIKGQMK